MSLGALQTLRKNSLRWERLAKLKFKWLNFGFCAPSVVGAVMGVDLKGMGK